MHPTSKRSPEHPAPSGRSPSDGPRCSLDEMPRRPTRGRRTFCGTSNITGSRGGWGFLKPIDFEEHMGRKGKQSVLLPVDEKVHHQSALWVDRIQTHESWTSLVRVLHPSIMASIMVYPLPFHHHLVECHSFPILSDPAAPYLIQPHLRPFARPPMKKKLQGWMCRHGACESHLRKLWGAGKR